MCAHEEVFYISLLVNACYRAAAPFLVGACARCCVHRFSRFHFPQTRARHTLIRQKQHCEPQRNRNPQTKHCPVDCCCRRRALGPHRLRVLFLLSIGQLSGGMYLLGNRWSTSREQGGVRRTARDPSRPIHSRLSRA